MKKSGFLLIGLATFIGVFAALQLNRYLDARRSGYQAVNWLEGSHIIPTLGPGDAAIPESPVDFRAAAKKVIPSVVSVDQYNHVQSWLNEDDRLQETGTGSGVIVAKNGIIVTNNHVVEVPNDPEHRIVEQVKVRLPDKRSFVAKVVGRDRRADLAVLKIEANDLKPIEVGDSSKLEVGQWVVAVGNPLGFDNTVSVGVVSSLGRSLGLQDSFLLDGIQTDAAINPGNSGGALTDSMGQLIGINSAIATGTGGSVGIGFAIPVNTVRRVVDQILKFGYAKYGGLGIGYDRRSAEVLQYQEGRDQIAQLVGSQPPDYGIVLTTVTPDGAAGKAGLQRFDIIQAVDGEKMSDIMDLSKILAGKQPNDSITVKYWSRGKTYTKKIQLQEVRGE